MVLPHHIIDATRRGDSRVVMAWLEAAPQGSVNEAGQEEGRWASHPLSLLYWSCIGGQEVEITDANVELARLLIARGADPNWRDHRSETPLHCVCSQIQAGAAADMASLLIEAGTEFDHRRTVEGENGIIYDVGVETPLTLAMENYLSFKSSADLKIICMLLRAGASLDTLGDNFVRPGPPFSSGHKKNAGDSAENFLLWKLRMRPHYYRLGDLEGDELQEWHRRFDALWALVAEVRAAGSWKKYVNAPRREFLAIRSLAVRGHLATSDPVLDFLVRADNGVLWNVLSFWGTPEGYCMSRPPARSSMIQKKEIVEEPTSAPSFLQRVVAFFTGRS